MKYNSLSDDREDHVSVTKCRGEERALRLSCFMVNMVLSCSLVQKVLRDAHLHLVRTPPSCNLDALLYGRHRGLSRWRLGPLLLYVTARPATKAPVTALLLTGSSLHGGPQCSEPSNTARTATSVALVTPLTCQPGTLRIVRMALLTEPVPRSVRQV